MTDQLACGNCGNPLGAPLPDLCPVCFGDPSAPTASAPAAEAPNGVVGEPEPTSRASRRGAHCATEDCTGFALPGKTRCTTCELMVMPSGLSYRLHSSWGVVVVEPGQTLTLGRCPTSAPATAAMLDRALRVSRLHADVTNEAGTLSIVDQSTNGTTLNGRRLRPGESNVLLNGDRVVLGSQVEFEVIGSG